MPRPRFHRPAPWSPRTLVNTREKYSPAHTSGFEIVECLCHHRDGKALTHNPHNSAATSGFCFSRGRRGLRALAPALVLLGVCVFAWGLRYKLSFYSPAHSAAHRMTEAKLLLPDRSTAQAAALHRAAESVPPTAIPLWVPMLFVLAGMNFCFGQGWNLQRGPARISSRCFYATPAFNRPPPRS